MSVIYTANMSSLTDHVKMNRALNKIVHESRNVPKANFHDLTLNWMNNNNIYYTGVISNYNLSIRNNRVSNALKGNNIKEGDILFIGHDYRQEYGYAIVGKGGRTFHELNEAYYGPCLHLNEKSMTECVRDVTKNEASRFKIPRKDYSHCSKAIIEHFKEMRFI